MSAMMGLLFSMPEHLNASPVNFFLPEGDPVVCANLSHGVSIMELCFVHIPCQLLCGFVFNLYETHTDSTAVVTYNDRQ